MYENDYQYKLIEEQLRHMVVKQALLDQDSQKAAELRNKVSRLRAKLEERKRWLNDQERAHPL